jgi:hypothetical protein
VPGSEAAARGLQVEFPAVASQGRDNKWYLLHLHIRAHVDQSLAVPNQLAYISASVNGFAAAQFELAPSTDGGVRWSALELLSGPVDGVTLVDDFELHFMNYLQVRSVVGGTSTLTIDLETQPSSGWLRSVELLPDTSVLESDMAPADIEMEASGKADISAGGSGELLVRLRSVGRNASDVKVFAHSLHNVLARRRVMT